MRRLGTTGIILLLGVGLATRAMAQNVEMEASVDRQQMSLDQTVTLTVTATIRAGGRAMSLGLSDNVCPSAFTTSPACDFVVVGSRQSQSMSIWGSSVQTSLTKVYELTPSRAGTHTIWATLNLDGTMYPTEQIDVVVIERGGPQGSAPSAAAPRAQPQPQPQPPASLQPPGPARPQPPPAAPPQAAAAPAAQAAPGPSPPTGSDRGPQTVVPQSVETNRPFLAVTVSRNPVHVGEQLTVDYELYSSLFENWELTGVQQPAYEDFWFENVGRERIGVYRPHQADVGGYPFRSQLASRFILVPLSPGPHEIAPIEVEASELFRGRLTGIVSPVASVEVLPLPEGAPRGFSHNNVGEVTFTMTIEEGGRRVGDPIRIRMRVEGTGLVSLFDLPELTIPGARIQPPVEDRDLRLLSDNRIGGYRQLEYVVFAVQEGELNIPAVTFQYFDPGTRQYLSIEAEGRTLDIQGFNPHADLVTVAEDEDLSLFLSALSPPREDVAPSAPGVDLPKEVFWVLVAFPPAVFLVVLIAGWASVRRARTAAARTQKTAGRRARSALKHAFRHRSVEEGLGQIATAMRQYLKERLDIKAGALTTGGTVMALQSRGIPEELAREVSDVLQTAELARFNQDGVERITAERIARRARMVLRQLEAQG